MKRILLTLTLTLVVGGLSIFAATDTPRAQQSAYRFSRLEATETSWDYTSIIYSIIDQAGHQVNVPASQITYSVHDRGSNQISYGKGVFVTINDTKMASEEDYSITITATIKKEKLSKAIYRKASVKKLILQQSGYSYVYRLMRPKYSNPGEYEKLNIDASDMTVEVSYQGGTDSSAFMLSARAGHATLTDVYSYKDFEANIATIMLQGKKVQLQLQPTIKRKDGSIRYAESYFEVTPESLTEIPVQGAMAADKEAEGEE